MTATVTLVAPLVTRLGAVPTGGAQAVVADLARGLGAAGERVELVAAPGSRLAAARGVTLRQAPGGPFPEELQALGGSHAPPRPPGRQGPVWAALAAQLDGEGAGPVHAHAMDWAAFAALAGRVRPTLHTLHLGPLDVRAAAALQAARSGAAPPTVVAPSRAVARLWERWCAVDAVIGNGVDTTLFAPSATFDRDLAVVAGRVSPEKGTDLAVAAARAAGMRVRVVGRVDDPAFLEERVRPLLDGDDVVLVGALPRRRLPALLAGAAVVVQASRWEEPFGMTAAEAAACGTPAAVTPVGGLPEVVGSGCGVVATATGVAAVAEAVRGALGLDRAAVRAEAVARLSLGAMVAAHRALYDQHR